MPQFDFTKTYQDGKTPTAKDLNRLTDSLESGFNQVKMDNANVATSGITTALLKDGSIPMADMPAVGHQISTTTGTFNTTSSSLVDVTNATVTITTTGRPVMLALISDGGGVGAGINLVEATSGVTIDAKITFDRGGTDIATFDYNFTIVTAGFSVEAQMPLGNFRHLDVVSAGTYTYKLRVAITTGDSMQVLRAKLVAYEL